MYNESPPVGKNGKGMDIKQRKIFCVYNLTALLFEISGLFGEKMVLCHMCKKLMLIMESNKDIANHVLKTDGKGN